MLIKLFSVFALTTVLVDPVSAASVAVSPFGERDGQPVYALALSGDIKAGDDLRVATLLGTSLVKDRFPGFMVLSSNGGDTNASLGIARIAHDYGIPVLVRAKCLSGCAIIALSAWRGRLFIIESGEIGLHQSWVGEDSARAITSMEATHRVARTLRVYGVPGWVVERMVRTPPRDMTYLSDAELRQLGALVNR